MSQWMWTINSICLKNENRAWHAVNNDYCMRLRRLANDFHHCIVWVMALTIIIRNLHQGHLSCLHIARWKLFTPIEAYVRWWIGSWLFQVMPVRLYGAITLPASILIIVNKTNFSEIVIRIRTFSRPCTGKCFLKCRPQWSQYAEKYYVYPKYTTCIDPVHKICIGSAM